MKSGLRRRLLSNCQIFRLFLWTISGNHSKCFIGDAMIRRSKYSACYLFNKPRQFTITFKALTEFEVEIIKAIAENNKPALHTTLVETTFRGVPRQCPNCSNLFSRVRRAVFCPPCSASGAANKFSKRKQRAAKKALTRSETTIDTSVGGAPAVEN